MPRTFKFYDISQLKRPKNIIKQARIVNKLINYAEKNKYRSRNTSNLTSEIFQLGNINNICSKRMNILNSAYQEHVINVMANGRSSILLQNLGIEITKVRLNMDYKVLNVYWITKNNTKKDLEVANILNRVAGEIQKEITELNLIGQSPYLKFVKDMFALEEIQVTKILDEIKLNNELPMEDSVEIIKIREKNELPQMRHDIFGLLHTDIMRRLNSKRENNEATEIQYSSDLRANKNAGNKVNIPFNKKELSRLLNKNYVLLEKLRKLENSKAFDQDFNKMEEYEQPAEDLNDNTYD